MPEYDNTNKGVLFKNDQKDPNDDRDRDYQGTINIEGVEYWLSAWIRSSKKDGSKFMSLAVKPKEARSASTQAPRQEAASRARDMDDEIPF